MTGLLASIFLSYHHLIEFVIPLYLYCYTTLYCTTYVCVVSWEGVARIDEEERRRGSVCEPPKEREKLCSWDALLQSIQHVAPSK